MALFTINTTTGEVKVIHRATDWLNHLEFSPTDPTLLMFCHEGPWHKVDRIWTIRSDGSRSRRSTRARWRGRFSGTSSGVTTGRRSGTICRLRAARISGWRDINVETGERTQYHLQRDEWSIHFNVTTDGKLICGDGGDPGQVARAKDGRVDLSFPAGSNRVSGRGQ